MTTNPSRINSIQYLRGIASCAIVLRHLTDRTAKYNIIAPGLNNIDIGGWGIDLFFVISGFVMVYITQKDEASIKYVLNFWLRRFLRISPLYYLITLIAVLAYFKWPNQTKIKPSVEHIIYSLTYLPYHTAPIVGVGWSLDYEMYFYLVFGIILFLPNQKQMPAIFLWSLVFVGFGLVYQGNDPLILQVTSPLLIEFILGFVIGHLFIRRKIWNAGQAFVVFIFSFSALILAEFNNVK